MARITFTIGNMDVFSKLADATDKDVKAATKAGAELLKTYTANQGRSMLSGPYATGQTISALTVKSSGKSAVITYQGTNKKGNRNGEVAFLNEYGARGKAARPFNRTAWDNNQSAIIQRMANSITKV